MANPALLIAVIITVTLMFRALKSGRTAPVVATAIVSICLVGGALVIQQV